jgi:hypothetical protein
VAQHRTYLVADRGPRRSPLRPASPGRHRTEGRRSPRVHPAGLGPKPGRHRRPADGPARRGRRLGALAAGLLAGVTVVSAWFAATGAVAMAAMVR